MNRDEKIKKLTNAIKVFRGRYNAKTGKWIEAPEPALVAIAGFKNFTEFHAWLQETFYKRDV